ncbi:transcription factor MYB46 [Corchorus olitorius]|uniref:Transcription factor MYB46 n=1 Tax=Corchorus olitorius TaxID=93759 RepID=A0A1R3KIJ4_9ROSI|nr:transcription factor MYB46 [Corchorus olitorius]
MDGAGGRGIEASEKVVALSSSSVPASAGGFSGGIVNRGFGGGKRSGSGPDTEEGGGKSCVSGIQGVIFGFKGKLEFLKLNCEGGDNLGRNLSNHIIRDCLGFRRHSCGG